MFKGRVYEKISGVWRLCFQKTEKVEEPKDGKEAFLGWCVISRLKEGGRTAGGVSLSCVCDGVGVPSVHSAECRAAQKMYQEGGDRWKSVR